MFGCFVSTGSTASVEVLGAAGFDFLVIDLEHGMSSERDILTQLQAMESTPAAGCVRVESHERIRVGRVLDFGAQGVMFPRVETMDEARACVAAMRYPPYGDRGVAVLVRASRYGARFAEYREQSRESLLTMLQIETSRAVDNVDEIAAVEGADVLFVGPMDLTTSMGIFRQYDHPDFLKALGRTVAAARRNGRAAGILVPAAADTRRYIDLGFTFLMCGTDVAFLQSAGRTVAETMRNA
jgi:4-hydroxy-2-oxoheptanedioate aldolase